MGAKGNCAACPRLADYPAEGHTLVAMCRWLLLIGAVFFLVGCDEGTTPQTTTPRAASTATTTTTFPPLDLEYALVPGEVLVYRVELTQDIALDTGGEAAPAAVAADELPGEAAVSIAAAGDFTYAVSHGPTEGTFAIDVSGSFDEISVSGTVDGNEVSDISDLERLGVLEDVATTLVVDRRGRDVAGGVSETGGAVPPLIGLASNVGGLFGPVLADDPVTVGDRWTVTRRDPVLGSDGATTEITSTVTGWERANGLEALLIESVAVGDEAAIDLAGFYREMLRSFGDGALEPAEESALDRIVLEIRVGPSSGEGQTWFDPAPGRVLRRTSETRSSVQLVAALPAEGSGELDEYEVSLEVDEYLEFVWVDTDGG